MMLINWQICQYHRSLKSKGAHRPKAQTDGAYPGFLSKKHACEYCYSPLYGMRVHHRVTPSSMLPVPIYTTGWRETKWSKFPCLRKQCVGRGLNPGHPDPEFEVLTSQPRTHSSTEVIFYAWFKNNFFKIHECLVIMAKINCYSAAKMKKKRGRSKKIVNKRITLYMKMKQLFSWLSLTGHLYRTNTLVKQTPRVGPCHSSLPLFDSLSL